MSGQLRQERPWWQVWDAAASSLLKGGRGKTAPPPTQLQPLVLPQLGQAWQEPARCIWTPHCMHMGASEWLDFRTGGASATAVRGVDSVRSSSDEADSIEGGS